MYLVNRFVRIFKFVFFRVGFLIFVFFFQSEEFVILSVFIVFNFYVFDIIWFLIFYLLFFFKLEENWFVLSLKKSFEFGIFLGGGCVQCSWFLILKNRRLVLVRMDLVLIKGVDLRLRNICRRVFGYARVNVFESFVD